MANKPLNGWVQDPSNPSRYTYTDKDGSVYESVIDDNPVQAPESDSEDVGGDPYGEAAVAPQAPSQAATAPTWVQDPKNPKRYTYTDTDGSVYESLVDDKTPVQTPQAAQVSSGVPFMGQEKTQDQYQKAGADQGNYFTQSIERQGGWGLSEETKNALGKGLPVVDALSGAADLAFRGYQGALAATEAAAEYTDDAFDATGLADLPSKVGIDAKLHPGEALMALGEAFPAGGAELGLHGAPKPQAVAPDADAAFAAATQAMIKTGATRKELDAFAAEQGRQSFGPELEGVLQARDTSRPWEVNQTYRTQSEEKAVKAAQKANPDDVGSGLLKAGHSREILDKQPFAPMKDRAEAAIQNRLDDINNRIGVLTEDWTNAPGFEVVHSVDDIADPVIRDSAKAAGSDALGFLGPDNSVYIVSENIKTPEELHSVVFHEALGHFGLAQKFGDELDYTLNQFYEGSTAFRQEVDDWMAKNPDYYEGRDNPELLAAEEVLAERSERGALPAALQDRVSNMIKGFGRQVGLNLEYSNREINTILGMSHDAVINGNGRDVIANGFKFARVYHGSPHDFDAFEGDRGGSGSGAQLVGHGTYFTDDIEYAKAYRRGDDGKLYVADIPDHNWLEWDKKLTDQPEAMAAFKRAGYEPWSKTMTAGDAYKDFAFEHGPEEASRLLNEEGISGNKYQDYDGTQNYVVYNPRDAQIVNKYMRRRQKAGDDRDSPSGAMMAGNINLDRLNTVHDVSRYVDDLAKDAPVEVKSFDQVKSEARSLNLNPTKVMKDKNGVGNISAKITAYRTVMTDVLDRTAELSKRLEENYNEADHQNYLQKLTQLAVVHARVSNDAAEVGRALSSLRIVTSSSKRSSEILEALARTNTPISSLADKDVFMRFMKQVQAMQDTGNPQGAATLMNKVVKPYWEDYVLSGRHAMMLSGLGTHWKNMRDNFNIIGREFLEAAIPVAWGGVSKEEMAGRMYGLLRAGLDATTYKDTWRAAKEGVGNTHLNTKTELEAARIPVASKVGDLLNAEDTLFRRFLETSNLYALGVRQARQQGFKGKQLFEQGSHLAVNATEEMLNEARGMADISLLVSEPSKLAKGIESIKARKIEMTVGERTGRFLAHLMFPFLRTTENLLYQQLRRSPLSFMDGRTREDFLAGGERRSIAISRTALGSMIIGYYIWQANEDNVTGNEKDYKKVQSLEPGGYKPNAVKTGDAYTDATALNTSFPNPFGLDNATAANVATLVNTYNGMVKSGESKASAVGSTIKAFVNVMGAASFAENMKPYVDMLSADGKDQTKTASAVGGLASQFVPAIGRQINNAVSDTQKRDYSGDRGFKDRVVGRVESGIPGLSDNFPLRYDVYGQPVEKGVGISGIGASSKRPTDPVVKEMIRVEESSDKPVITPAPRDLSIEGMKTRLTGENYAEFQRLVGTHLREVMTEVVKTDGYKKMPDKDKRQVLREAQSEARDQAKQEIVSRLSIDDFKNEDEDK